MYNNITYQEETHDELFEDIKTLLKTHYEETVVLKDKLPLDPDFEAYKALSDSGIMYFHTVREDGGLIGYSITVVKNHPHYKTVTYAFNDMIYLDKEYRDLSIGRELISFSEEELKKKGVSVMSISTKTHMPFDTLLLTSGYDCVERLYSKYIGE